MRAFLLGLILLFGLSVPVTAQNAEIEATITAQIDAFKADDFDGAFSYASPTIKDIFKTPENFGAMVQNGYPMVWRPGEVRYLELREVAGNLWQRVMITDQKGAVHFLDYQMIPSESGWKINAVQRLRPPAPSA